VEVYSCRRKEGKIKELEGWREGGKRKRGHIITTEPTGH
jgi:hypothetical protein